MEPGAGVAWMAACADAVAARRPPVGVVVAPDLAGRSEALAAAASATGRPAVSVVALAAEQGLALGALRALDPALDPADLIGARARLADHLAGSVLVVDDAHHLDDGSLTVLAGLVARPDGHDVGVVVGHRPAPHEPLAGLAQAVAAAGGPVVRAGDLDPDEVGARLAAGTGRPVAPAVADAVAALTAGRLGLVDLLAAQWSDGLPEAGQVPDTPPGPGLVEALQARIEALGSPARRLLLALALAPDRPDLAADGAVLDLPPTPSDWAALRGAGLLRPVADAGGSTLEQAVPLVARVVLGTAPPEERRSLEERIGRALGGSDPATAARHLQAAGARGSAATAAFAAAARAAVDPAEAVAWVDRAVAAATVEDLGAQASTLATALVLAGDLDGAGAHLDRALAGDEAAEGLVAAALAAHRQGRAEGARRFLVAASAAGHPTAAALAVPAAVGRGHRDEGAPPPASPTAPMAHRAVVDLADAARRAVVEDPAGARGFLEAAALLAAVHPLLPVPEHPAVLGAAAASVAGDRSLAADLLRRAREAALPGLHRPAVEAWSVWVDPDAPEPEPDPGEVPARDGVVAVAVQARRARRAGDLAGLHDACRAAEPMLIAVTPDLWLLEPVAELAVAAARLDPQQRAVAGLDVLDEAADRVGAAPAWRVALAWGRLQVALAADDADGVGAAAARLADLAADHPLGPEPGALAGAAAVWADVVAGRVDVPRVEAAAAALAAVGRAWDASRLVGQAAVRTEDAGAARSLLVRARELAPDEGAAGAGSTGVLSEREVEVARLVLDGRTHKEIGAQLFLSPKTIEHHVARIRTKLGATSRAEMLAALRRELG